MLAAGGGAAPGALRTKAKRQRGAGLKMLRSWLLAEEFFMHALLDLARLFHAVPENKTPQTSRLPAMTASEVRTPTTADMMARRSSISGSARMTMVVARTPAMSRSSG